MAYEFKQNTANWILIGIFDDVTGAGITGLIHSDIVFKIGKPGVAGAPTKTTSASDWKELANGWYQLLLSTGDCDTLGSCEVLTLYLGASGGYPYTIVANLEADTFARLGAPAGVSTAADIAAIQAKTVNLPGSPAAVGSPMGTVSSVTGNVAGSVVGDVQGKVLGGGASAMTAAGVRAVDGAGNAVAPAGTALSTAQWTNARAALVDNADVAVSTRLATAGYTAPDNADLLLVKAKTDNLPATPASQGDVTTVGTAVAAVSTKLGAPAGASVSVDVAAVKTDTAAIKAKTDNLPSDPADQSLIIAATDQVRADIASLTPPNNAGIAAIKAKTDALPASPANEVTSAAIQGIVTGNGVAIALLGGRLARALGLLDENTVRDQTVYDGDDLTSARIRLYDTEPHAQAAGATGLVDTYAATYVYSAPGKLLSATVTRVGS